MSMKVLAFAAAATLAASLLVNPTPADARNNTGAIIGGIAAGAIIGGAIANSNRGYAAPGYYAPPPPVYYAPPPPAYYGPPRGDAVGYCMSRFRSYNPNTGTYIGYDGLERPCP